MALRTIEAPGTQINEVDKSQYTPSMTGTRCYVMGYSDKGTPYEPMQFTSKAAWQNYYGEPDNEAERYFYNACSEVINQNGVLYCARLPYDNTAFEKMVGFKYKVANTTTKIPSAGEYLINSRVSAWVDHDSDFEIDALNYVLDNKCYREINGIVEDGLEQDKEVKTFYKAAIKSFNKTYNNDADYQRKSVSYYKVNLEKSYELSARFGTRKEALAHLADYKDQTVPGYYMYYTGDECLISDDGDWIAQPLYYEYNKEVKFENHAGWRPLNEISCQHAIQDETWNFVETCNTRGHQISVGGVEITSKEQLNTYTKLKNTLTTLSNDTEVRGYISISSIENVYKNLLNSNNESTYPLSNEIKSTSYAQWRSEVLLSTMVTAHYLKLYNGGDIQPREGLTSFHKYISASWETDGANNEHLANNTIRQLYDDQKMKLKDWVEDKIAISSLIEGTPETPPELWGPYMNKKITEIIREKPKEGAPYISTWNDILLTYKKEGGITFEKMSEKYGVFKERIKAEVPYSAIVDADPNLNDYLLITHSGEPTEAKLSEIDEFRTGEQKVDPNTFWIYDKTCATLNSIPEDSRKGKGRQMIGLIPIVTTAANALYAQSLINVEVENIDKYETISGTKTKTYNDGEKDVTNEFIISSDVSMRFSQKDKYEHEKDRPIDTLSRDANNYFLPIGMNSTQTGFDTDNTKKIGVVVVKAFLDVSEGNKVSFTPVESFCGSLDKNAKNKNTGVSEFIDEIINTQSDYIYFFSNCFVNEGTRKEYDKADLFINTLDKVGMLGWYSDETEDQISLSSMYTGIEKCFKNVEDINERDIDIVCDAGLANIAQYIKSIYNDSNPHKYDLNVTNDKGDSMLNLWKCNSIDSVSAWKAVQMKYDTFCKKTRKDCMFIADGPRPLVLQGQKKIVRPTNPKNTIDANILPNVKYVTGLNTNYGAGYMDWFKVADDFTGDEFWCPPSIKAMGVYINTDLNFNYWDAPAGLTRGVIQALDCAFSPTIKQAGPIYQKNWNYAINYPNDGIILEGQKTFQTKPTALDRVNVRRLMLRLERQTGKVLRFVTYEGNTSYLRQRVIDLLTPYFQQAKIGGGLYDFKIICDESNNTATTIDNNELRITIGLKPTKTVEFILCDFVLMSTGASWNEL